MLANEISARAGPLLWPSVTPGLGITDQGIVCGKGVILAHMTGGGGETRLALEADQDRLVVLLSVIGGRPIAATDVLHHVEAASGHWRRGYRALANPRLVFSGLPRPDGPVAAHRLRVAADLLDEGFSPASLMKALWPEQAEPIEKYAPDQPRVPAGKWATERGVDVRG